MICLSETTFVLLVAFIPIAFMLGVITAGTNQMILAVCVSFIVSLFAVTFIGHSEPQKRTRSLRRMENRVRPLDEAQETGQLFEYQYVSAKYINQG